MTRWTVVHGILSAKILEWTAAPHWDGIQVSCIAGGGFFTSWATAEGHKHNQTTRMGFEPTRAEHNGLAVHRLNHSATSSRRKLQRLETFKIHYWLESLYSSMFVPSTILQTAVFFQRICTKNWFFTPSLGHLSHFDSLLTCCDSSFNSHSSSVLTLHRSHGDVFSIFCNLILLRFWN